MTDDEHEKAMLDSARATILVAALVDQLLKRLPPDVRAEVISAAERETDAAMATAIRMARG